MLPSSRKAELVLVGCLILYGLLALACLWLLRPMLDTEKTAGDVPLELLAGIFASFFAVFLALYIDRQKRAKLQITAVPDDRENEEADLIDPDNGNRSTKRKFLHVNVRNPPLWPIHSLFHDREAALAAVANIEFYPFPTGDARELPELTFRMAGKWRENLVPDFSKDEENAKKVRRGFFDTRNIPSEKDNSNMANHLDIAMKIDNDCECYGHNLEAVFYKEHLLRNPHTRLDCEHYLVRVELRTAGHTCSDYFELLNPREYSGFRLLAIEETRKHEFDRLRSRPQMSTAEPESSDVPRLILSRLRTILRDTITLLLRFLTRIVTALVTILRFFGWILCQFPPISWPPPGRTRARLRSTLRFDLAEGFWFPDFTTFVKEIYERCSLAKRLNTILSARVLNGHRYYLPESPRGVSELYAFLLTVAGLAWLFFIDGPRNPAPGEPLPRLVASLLVGYFIAELFFFCLHWIFVAPAKLEGIRRSLASFVLDVFLIAVLFTILFRLNMCQTNVALFDALKQNLKSLLRLVRVEPGPSLECQFISYSQLAFAYVLIAVILASILSPLARKEKTNQE